ncbi:MAG: hypothetical protein LBP95_01770 [Deltaproteobacteria bacterium]|jgi:protein-S-isoprenylcysteine O-methyltransferase Ste14|nr:hypothetical protein [Deltaproteobacteria bacterium]
MIRLTGTEGRLLNVLLFLFFAWGLVLALPGRVAGGMGPLDVSMTAQNVVFCLVVLFRRADSETSPSVAGQFFALAAFLSGLAFIVPPDSGPAGGLARAGLVVVVSANLLAAAAMLNLGRDFGILIGRRKLKTGGLYAVVRHPMYLSDILLRLGFAMARPGAAVAALAVLSVGLYGLRAGHEEKFLSEKEDYVEYQKKVPWKFIPGVY